MEIKTMQQNGLALSSSDDQDDGSFERIERSNALEPGQYWRLTKSIKVKNPHSSFYSDNTLHEGDLHLVTKLFEFEGVLHSITFLEHPREVGAGNFSSYTLLTKDFLDAFEPVQMDEAKAIRADEQSEVMEELREIQEEMQQAIQNPLALPPVQEAAKEAVEEFEENEAARVQTEVRDADRRAADLRRIHRRAARRSEAKGNPVAVRKATISDRLDVMIAEGVTSDGVRELKLEAGRRLAIAKATSTWLEKRTRAMSEVMKKLTPYAAESAQLALASASSAIDRVTEIERGITSLKLYTGDGVDIVPVREGADASTREPLTLMQRKLAMDEELVVHADIEDDFDCGSQEIFFKRLATDDKLLDQILPTPRCVVSMLTTRRRIQYNEKMDPFERVAREIDNKRVFLLVRNGQNVHAIYSCEPSHEAAARLFPTEAEIHAPFKGLDGSSIGLQDVAFGKASGRFEDQALHYRRFLILLCGLDHRLNMFGEFYPPEQQASFMSQSFQERYFRFIEDDDESLLLGGDREYVHRWMRRHNANLRSGSRVIVQSGAVLAKATPHIARSKNTEIDQLEVRRGVLIAAEKSGSLYLQIPTVKDNYRRGTAAAWVSGPDAYKHDGMLDWFLCVDRVRAEDVRRYIADRTQRIGSISWLRTLRRVEAQLQADELQQQDLRRFLRQSALDAGVHTTEGVDEAVDQAIATWRADHRGAPAPDLTEKTAVSQLLSLVFPRHQLAQTMQPLVEELCKRAKLYPIMLTRTGSNEFVLYSITPIDERRKCSSAVKWGWVQRNLLKMGKTKLSLGSESVVWLQKEFLEATEEIVVRWPDLDEWTHDRPEPCPVRVLKRAVNEFYRGQRLVEHFAEAKKSGAGIDQDLLEQWLKTASSASRDLTNSQTAHLWIPLGAYQAKPGEKPTFIYAKSTLVGVVKAYGTKQQKELLLATKGFRSQWARNEMAKTENDLWSFMVCKELHTATIELSGRLRQYSVPTWSQQHTRAPGGYKRKERSSRFHGPVETRADRRKQGGDPRHSGATVTLSFNRAIDTLMGVNPGPRRDFYKAVEQRVDRIWGGTRSHEQIQAEREAERSRRYEPSTPVAFDLAPCLWNASRGRSLANKYFNQKAAA